MDGNDHCHGNFFGRTKMRKSCRKMDFAQEGTLQNGIGKSVFGRWLKEFRSGQNRDPKPQRPLGRTLSANYRDKDNRKKKIGRTLSANQKDRKKMMMDDGAVNGEVEMAVDWDSGLFRTRNEKSPAGEDHKRDGPNKCRDETRPHGTEFRERSLSDASPEIYFRKRLDSREINPSALVSYLDEEGLKELDGKETGENVNATKSSGQPQRHRSRERQDGVIMPTSSLRKTSTGVNHYENRESIFLKEKNNKEKNLDVGRDQSETDYSRIRNSGDKSKSCKTSFNYYNDHRYENLETTDYISWSKDEKDDKFGFESEEEKICRETRSDVSPKSEEKPKKKDSLECGFRFGFPTGDWCRGQDVPEAPARDPSSLKSIKYGPGHEKYPSWPGSVRPETGAEKPQRSHSWTEKTNYPKEKVTNYVKPHVKRTNPTFTQQLKTVMERCEKISPESYQKTMDQVEEREKRRFLPKLDREGNSLGDQDYMVPSPPERDKPSLTQVDLEKYYQENHLTKIDSGDYSTPYEDVRKLPPLTQADLEEYARSYDDVIKPLHQHQGSYAQSEGYHSYVSSSEITTTPFLDRLRRESENGIRSQHWSEEDNRAGRDSVVTTSSGSASSSETLKWHGSMSDVSVGSGSCRSRQQIAHSSRVPPPQRHHSESVLYLGNQTGGGSWQSKGDRSQQLKLFPVNTYTVQPNEQSKPVISPTSVPKMSVAERISELERQQQQQQQSQRFAYYDPEKRHKVSDPTLKAIQKKALLSFYERHQHGTTATSGPTSMQTKLQENWKGEPKSASMTTVQDILQRSSGAPPPPPPRPVTSRRSSCASDLSTGSWSKSNHSYSNRIVGPAIIGPSISVDDWVPELPPKKPHLRAIPPPLPQRSPSPNQVPPIDSGADSLHFHKSLPSFNRMPTPDLPPPPPPPPSTEDEALPFDEPLPPPPPEVEWHLATAVPRRSTPMSSGRNSPQSPTSFSPIKDCTRIESSGTLEQNESVRSHLVPDAYEIQYDQNAINAIMESNRLAELQKKKHFSKGKYGAVKEPEEKSPLRTHIENRPPLPLPRDAQINSPDVKQTVCDRQKSEEDTKTSPFARSHSKVENANRASVKGSKNESNPRGSLRYPSKKSPGGGNGSGKGKERLGGEVCAASAKSPQIAKAPKSTVEHAKPFLVKKASEYECRIPSRERDGLTVFETTAIDELKNEREKYADLQSPKGSNSKAAFFALRREKEIGVTNCEGSYKLTVSSSGERIETTNGEKFPLEMIKMKEKSTENLVLDNRLTLEPPDLIPKISNFNRKSSSAHDVRDNRKKYDYNRFGNEKYRLVPAAGNNGNGRLGMFSENIIQHECKVTFGIGKDEKAKDERECERIPVTTVECVRAVITKLETEPPERLEQRKESAYQSKSEDEEEEVEESVEKEAAVDLESEANGRTEPEKVMKEPAATSLFRVRSNLEKRLNRSESIKSNEGSNKVERSKSLKLVERSTSFGRSDTMRVIGIVERSEERSLNLSVSDASSQTDLLEEEPVRDEATRRKLEEDMECERLSRDLASQLPPSDKLQSLLVPDSERKKPTDYVAGLFRLELSYKPRRHFFKMIETSPPRNSDANSDVSSPQQVNGVASNQNEIVRKSSSPSSFLDSTESKSKTSNSKFSEANSTERDSRQLRKKKEELMSRLDKKLSVLKEEREALTNESAANEELGLIVAQTVAKSTRPHELAKYRLHVEEVGKITSLLLGLSGRLAKVENALTGLPAHHDDRKTHEGKRDKLREQLAEAKQLKENIDRRSDSVAKTLGKHLNADEFADYVYFIRTKAKLIVDMREIAEKISLGEDQLAALRETLSS